MTEFKKLSMHNTINLVIFDCDGVLVDSEILSQRVLLNMLEKVGVVVSEDYFLTHFLGFNFEHVTAKVFADFTVTLTSEFRQSYRAALINSINIRVSPGSISNSGCHWTPRQNLRFIASIPSITP